MSDRLPRGWSRVSLKEVANSIQYGHTASAIERTEGPRFLRITDIQDGRVDWDNVPSCDIPKGDIPKYRLSSGDLVFARTGATTGKSFLIQECPEAVFASYLIRVRVSADLDSRFLSAFFQSPDYWNQIESSKRGIGQPNVNGKVLGEVKLPVPPLPEQRRIVAEIEKQFSRLEEGVGALRRVQANLKRYRAAVLKAACEGKLVPTEAELFRVGRVPSRGAGKKTKDAASGDAAYNKAGYETGKELLARILAERRKNWQGRGKYKESAAPETAKPGTLPEGWVWASVDQIAEVGTGATPKRGTPKYYAMGTIPWINSAALNIPFVDSASESVTKAALAETNLTLYPPGTLLLAMYGEGKTRGKCSELRIAATTNQAIAAIKCSDEIRAYLKLALWRQYEDLRLAASGGVQPNLNLSLVRAIVVPMPPQVEQSRIVAEVERRLSVVEEMEATVEANLQRATRLRQSILQKAFEGKLA